MNPTSTAGGMKAPLPPLRHIFRIDLRSLAAFRIGIALVILWDLCVRAVDLQAHYTDAGVLPRSALIDTYLAQRPYLSLHILNGSALYAAALFCLSAIFALALLLGCRTRIATVASWFLACSLHARNPLVVHGGDDILRMLLFWGVFVPLGGKWSVDRARTSEVDTEDTGVCSAGAAGLLLQMCYIYLFSAALKSGASWRRDGTAVYLILSLEQFTTPLGKALLPYHNLLRAMTYGTLVLETAGPLIALFSFDNVRWRVLTVAAFIGFHIGLGLCIELGIFPAVCIVGWLAFLPGAFWDAMSVRVAPMWTRFRGQIPAVAIARLTNLLHRVPFRPMQIRPSLIRNAIAASALLYISLWNARTSDFNRIVRVFPRSLNVIGEALRIDQYWNLFAPYPSLEHGWYVVYAKLKDGEEVDLLTGKAVTWDKPPLVSATYKNERWRKYLMNLESGQFGGYKPYYAQYLQRTWNDLHPLQRHLAHMEICFQSETVLRNYHVSPRRKIVLWSQDW